ncbi:hypothetical protein GCM10025773_11900 [Microbacterium jejuense]
MTGSGTLIPLDLICDTYRISRFVLYRRIRSAGVDSVNLANGGKALRYRDFLSLGIHNESE